MTQRKPQPGDGKRMLNVRIEGEQIDRLRVVAKAEHRTVSQELRRLIELRLAEAETQEAA